LPQPHCVTVRAATWLIATFVPIIPENTIDRAAIILIPFFI
jgi:hypothetical protein